MSRQEVVQSLIKLKRLEDVLAQAEQDYFVHISQDERSGEEFPPYHCELTHKVTRAWYSGDGDTLPEALYVAANKAYESRPNG